MVLFAVLSALDFDVEADGLFASFSAVFAVKFGRPVIGKSGVGNASDVGKAPVPGRLRDAPKPLDSVVPLL